MNTYTGKHWFSRTAFGDDVVLHVRLGLLDRIAERRRGGTTTGAHRNVAAA